jgi:hypothetical protein
MHENIQIIQNEISKTHPDVPELAMYIGNSKDVKLRENIVKGFKKTVQIKYSNNVEKEDN